MKMFFYVFGIFSFLSLVQPAVFANQLYLLPTPKEIRNEGVVTLPRTGYLLDNRISGFDPAEMLRDGLSRLGIAPSQSGGGGFVILFEKTNPSSPKLPDHPEAYRFVVGKNGITVTADTVAGAWRGAGRVISFLCGPDVKITRAHLTLPALTLTDYPDIDTRAMKLEFPKTSGKEFEDYGKNAVRSVAMFGFNLVFFDFRGELESKKYPEVVQRPVLLQKDMRELIRYARACGLEVCPMTSSIGHLNRGPHIFPLQGISGRTFYQKGKMTNIVMDLSHPKFYEVYLGYLDEVCQLFDTPRYFMIGGDEFEDGVPVLDKVMGKPFPDYFSEFLTRTHRHMLEKNRCKIVVWQDMMFPKQKHWYIDSPANGPANALQVLDKLPRDLSVAMWKYNYDARYPQLVTLKEKGFTDLWGAPWYDPAGCAALSRRCHEFKAKLLGTTWWVYLHQQGVPVVGEFAWNAAKSQLHDPRWYDTIMDHYYYGPDSMVPVDGTWCGITGGMAPDGQMLEAFKKINPSFAGAQTVDAPLFAMKELSQPWDFASLAEKKQLPDLAIQMGNCPALVSNRKTFCNSPREAKNTIIYTPEYGASTGTNIHGAEMAVVDGRITELSGRARNCYVEERGDMNIPRNGVVFSSQGKMYSSSLARMSRNYDLRPGVPIRLFLLPDPEVKVGAPSLICHFSGKKPNVRIYITTLLPFIMPQSIVNCHMDTLNGRENTLNFNSRRFLMAQDPKFGKWTCSMLPGIPENMMPVLMLEWRAGADGVFPKQAVFSVQRGGMMSRFTILGCEEFE